MSGLQLYLKLQQVCLRNGDTLQKQNYRQVTSDSFPTAKKTAFPQKKEAMLLSCYFRNHFVGFLFLDFFQWFLSFIGCDTLKPSKPNKVFPNYDTFTQKNDQLDYTHTEKACQLGPARISRETTLRWTVLLKSPSGLPSTWTWAHIPGTGHDESSRSVRTAGSPWGKTKWE